MSIPWITSQISIFSIVILIVIFYTNSRRNAGQPVVNLLYHLLIFSTILILATDIFTEFVNGNENAVLRNLHIANIIIYYFLHLVIVFIWALYVSYQIEDSTKKFKKIIIVFAPFILFIATLLLININRNIIFEISSDNIYSRGKYMLIVPVISYVFMCYPIVMLFKNKKKINPHDFKALLLYPLPPAIVGVIQISFPGLNLIWPSMSLSILIVYIFVQSRISSTDYLTGLFNRREFEAHLKKKFFINKNKNLLGSILIDINNFKYINDNFYHFTGDLVLIDFANVLKRSVEKNDFIARIGGDEFIILFESTDDAKLNQIVTKVNDEIKKYNEKNDLPYKIDISYGACYFDKNKHNSIDEYLKMLDIKMYEMKRK